MSSRILSYCLFLAVCFVGVRLAHANDPNVQFDVPAVVVAEPLNPAVVDSPLTGGEMVRLRIAVSACVAPDLRGAVNEYAIQISSVQHSLRIVDFWPKQELYSEVAGNVHVQEDKQTRRSADLNLSAVYEPLLKAGTTATGEVQSGVQESYDRKPQMQVLTASGTTQRGYGVFFKFRPGASSSLEGVREVAILAEVPAGWRADLLQVSMVASSGTKQRVKEVGSGRFWMASHREGDRAAAAEAMRYVTQERRLRALAAANRQQVKENAYPTLLHRVGAALDVWQPRIPEDYLQQVLFSSGNRFRDNPATNRLPVDLRVAVLDYWDAREKLVELARVSPRTASGQALVSVNTQ